MQVVHRSHPYPRDDRGLGGVADRHDHPPDAGLGRGGDHREHAAHRSDRPVEPQLAEDHDPLQGKQRQFTGAAE